MIIEHRMNIKVIGLIHHVCQNVRKNNKFIGEALERQYQSKQACIPDVTLLFLIHRVYHIIFPFVDVNRGEYSILGILL